MILKNGTRLWIAVLLCFSTGTAQKTSEQHPIAQGDYLLVSTGDDGPGKAIDHWRMYALPDGSFRVDVDVATVPAPDKAEEHRRFTKSMKLAGYEWVMSRVKEGKSEPASIRCDFTPAEARCAGKTVDGRDFSTSLALKAPYAFMTVTDAPLFDLPWAMQAMVWQAQRSTGLSTLITWISLMDRDTEYATELKAGWEKPAQIRYLGKDNIEIAARKVMAHKFEIRSPDSEDAMSFWFSDSGLLLKMTGLGSSVTLANYQGPPLQR